MSQQHPIIPSIALVEQWMEEFKGEHAIYLATHAAQWGADQELEECIDWVDFNISGSKARELHATRRSDQPSIRKQALNALGNAHECEYPHNLTILTPQQHAIIRQALEQLDD